MISNFSLNYAYQAHKFHVMKVGASINITFSFYATLTIVLKGAQAQHVSPTDDINE